MIGTNIYISQETQEYLTLEMGNIILGVGMDKS